MVIRVADETTPDPEHQAGAAELREVMEREAAALPDAFRMVVVLRDVEGLSTAGTASVLGISEDLVNTRLHRSRTLLRERLYERAGVTLDTIFAFGNARCDRLVDVVMSAITNGTTEMR